MPPEEPDTEFRISDAVGQLTRYGGVVDTRLVDVLELLGNINDDMMHDRHSKFVNDSVDHACRILHDVAQDYVAREI